MKFRKLEAELADMGWELVSTASSHRKYNHVSSVKHLSVTFQKDYRPLTAMKILKEAKNFLVL